MREVSYLIFRTRENTGTWVICNHIRELKKLGYDTSLYSLFGKSSKWFPYGIKSEPFYKIFFSPPDILISTFWPTSYVSLFLPAKSKYYLVQGLEENFYSNFLLKKAVHSSYALPLTIISISNYLTNILTKQTKKRIYTLKNVPINKLAIAKKSKIRNKTIRILSVISWYNKAKGPDVLVDVIKEIKKQNQSYKFILVSREMKAYSDDIDEFYSNPPQQKLKNLYKTSDILLVTSRSEGFYMPGLEAMAAGCVVITSNNGGVSDYCINQVNAIILKKASATAYQKAIQKLINDKVMRDMFIKNGYKTAQKFQKITWRKIAYDLNRIFTQQ